MKYSALILTLLILVIGCNSESKNKNANSGNAKIEINSKKVKEVNFIVEGMTCEGCENAIQKCVNELPGILEVSASHEEKNTIVSYDTGQTSADDIHKAIEGKGYDVLGLNE